MKELKSGWYLIKGRKIIKMLFKDVNLGVTRFVSKDFNKIDIDRFNGCILWCSHTPINLDIEIYEMLELKKCSCPICKREINMKKISPESFKKVIEVITGVSE